MDYGEQIRQIRLSRKMSQVEFADAVGATQVAVHGWESGKRKPNLESARAICKGLGISADTLLNLPPVGYEVINTLDLTDKEQNLLSMFRELDDFGKEAVRLICEHESMRVLFHADNVTDIKQVTGERYIPKYLSSAAAGIAAPIDEAEFDLILVDESVPEGADYAVVIDGDSMEPDIKNRSTVFVKKTHDLQIGDVGIFSVNGSIVCKMFYKTGRGDIGLISLNPKRASSNVEIKRDSTDTFECLGKVILKKKPKLPDYFMDSL